MMTIIRIHASGFRLLLILSVACVTILVLLLGTKTLSLPGISPLAFAHAQGVVAPPQGLCATNPTDQNCTNQDPMIQGCNTDAQTLVTAEIRNQQGTLLATVERRYSPTCHSEWARILEAGQGHQPLAITNKAPQSQATPGNVVYTVMFFVSNLSIAPEIIAYVSTNGIDPATPQSHAFGLVLPGFVVGG